MTVTLAGLSAAGTATASTTYSRSGPLTASLTAGTHTPDCRQKWPVTVAATWNGHPAHASAYYQFLYQGQVVGTQNPFSTTAKNRRNRPWTFYKSFYDNTFGPFGANAVGQPLTVRAVVRDGRYTVYPSYWVKVRGARGCPPSR